MPSTCRHLLVGVFMIKVPFYEEDWWHFIFTSRMYFHSFTFVTYSSPLLPPQTVDLDHLTMHWNIYMHDYICPLKCCTSLKYPNIHIWIDILVLKHRCFSPYFQGVVRKCVFPEVYSRHKLSAAAYTSEKVTCLHKKRLSCLGDLGGNFY